MGSLRLFDRPRPRMMTVTVPKAVGYEGGTVAIAAILERAVADPVARRAGEEVTGGSIMDRVGVGECRGHEAGRQDGGRQTCVSRAGVSNAGASSDCHLHLPSWLMPGRRRRDVSSPTKQAMIRFPVRVARRRTSGGRVPAVDKTFDGPRRFVVATARAGPAGGIKSRPQPERRRQYSRRRHYHNVQSAPLCHTLCSRSCGGAGTHDRGSARRFAVSCAARHNRSRPPAAPRITLRPPRACPRPPGPARRPSRQCGRG